ncbi:MAG: DUF1080 domain-containing protein [Pirellulaceae bacterium]|nr:DUF1080 domain-containing protein [Pirellulaceae bacterium]
MTTARMTFWLAVLFAGGAALLPPAGAAEPASQPVNGCVAESETKLFDGRSLAGWKLLDKFSFEKHGPVKVVDGELILAAGAPGTGIVWQGKPPRDNYELSLLARRRAGDDFFCGLTFPVGDEHCTLVLGGWGGSVTGLSNIDDASAVENETTGSVTFQQNQWYTIRLRVTPEKITAWVDKEEIVALSRKDRKFAVWWEQEPARPLGIVTWETEAGFKDLRLRTFGAR